MNEETPTPKEHQSCRECLNTSKGKNIETAKANKSASDERKAIKVAASEQQTDVHVLLFESNYERGLSAAGEKLHSGVCAGDSFCMQFFSGGGKSAFIVRFKRQYMQLLVRRSRWSSSVQLRRGQLRETLTRSNKIKHDNQGKSRLISRFTTGMPVPEVNVPCHTVLR